MLTKEQVRARYFACHIGCNVKYPKIDNGYTVAMLTGVSRTDGLETTFKRKKKGCAGDYLSFKNNGNHNSDALHTQLLLRPLSAITDVDAVEVAKLVYGNEFGVSSWKLNRSNYPSFVALENMDDDDYTIMFTNGKDRFKEPSIETYLPNNQHTTMFDVADYLRSRGYYTGSFMGYDSIAEGWAIMDEKNGAA